jgi:2'-5' RNA ligase
MLRLFTAIELPLAAKTRLSLLASGLQGARWLSSDNYHLTLAFVGEVDEGEALQLHQELAGVKAKPFLLRIKGVGSFETKGKLRTLWAGVEACEALTVLQGRVAGACQRAGVRIEARKFKPHISLARFSAQPSTARLGDWLAGNALLSLEPIEVRAFTLFRSHLGGEGAHYEALERYSF